MMKMVMLMFLALMIPFAAAAALVSASDENLAYNVGNSQENGWRLGINYTEWANQYHFYIGDSLFFGYDPNMYDVLQVYQMDYEACRSDSPILNFTGGTGKDIFVFTSANSFYFLSSGGYCSLGMKLSVTVEEAPTTPPNSTSSNNTSLNNTVIPSPATSSNVISSPATSSKPTMKKFFLLGLFGFVLA